MSSKPTRAEVGAWDVLHAFLDAAYEQTGIFSTHTGVAEERRSLFKEIGYCITDAMRLIPDEDTLGAYDE